MTTPPKKREGQGDVIPCACGCGGTLRQFDADGREHRFLRGHYLRAVVSGSALHNTLPR